MIILKQQLMHFFPGMGKIQPSTLGNNNETTVLEIAHKIIEITQSTSKIVHLPALKEGRYDPPIA